MSISGVICKILPEERHRDFTKKVFWVKELNVKYGSTWALEFWHDAVSELSGLNVGDVVECDFLVHGRLYDDGNKVRIILQAREIKLIYKSGGGS